MLRNTVSPTHQKIGFARSLRQRQTPAEKVLWRKLRRKHFASYSFRRQVPIGHYIVDFLCVKKKLIVEIDGDSHYEPGAQERDQMREAYLRKQGFSIVRFGEKETYNSVDSVLLRIGVILGCTEE